MQKGHEDHAVVSGEAGKEVGRRAQDAPRMNEAMDYWKLVHLAGLPRAECHPHMLRHSCAISLLMKGADIKTVKGHLGHKSLLTTVAFYGNLGAEDWLKKSTENVRTRLFI
jgi:site-specific recombinase XerD